MARIVQADPKNEAVRFDLTYLLREAGQLPEALAHLRYLMATNPSSAAYYEAYLATAYLAGKYYQVLTTKAPEETAEVSSKGLAAYELEAFRGQGLGAGGKAFTL